MFKKYLKDTWIDKNGIEWYREKNGGFIINLLSDKVYNLMSWVDDKIFKYQLLADIEQIFDKEIEDVVKERLSKYDTLNAKFTESFGDDWGDDDDYFEGAAI